MSGRSAVERAVDLYFEGINGNNAAIVPLAEDVVFNGPMLPEPRSDEAAVRRHLDEIAPFIARMERKLSIIEGDHAAAMLEFERVNGVVIEGAEFFRVHDGRISYIQTFYDTRP